MIDNTNEKLDIYYNFRTDLSFDQNDQQHESNTSSIEESLPIIQEALQLVPLQHYNTTDIDNTPNL